MAKKKSSSLIDMNGAVPHAPSRSERVKMDAEHMARTMVETHPAVQKTRKQVTRKLMEMADGMKVSFGKGKKK